MMLSLFSALLFLAALFAVIWQWREKKKMYRCIDKMLDDVLDRSPVTVSDLREGPLSSLANKVIRIQENLEKEVQQAEKEKEQVKSLISNMSHQLKTPLANVVMYRELLEGNVSVGGQPQIFLHKMKLQLDKIDWLLRSLFKMVKLEQGVIDFEVTPSSLEKTLLNAINTVYEKAEKKKITIWTEPFTDCILKHNSKWTAEVFANIFENAIKYTNDGGKIQIRVRPMELFTEIQIEDTGRGIRDSELTLVFQRFYRSKEVENQEGSGIGLYLSRLILEKEKGYITVSSKYGKGSCFSVFLQNCQN